MRLRIVTKLWNWNSRGPVVVVTDLCLGEYDRRRRRQRWRVVMYHNIQCGECHRTFALKSLGYTGFVRVDSTSTTEHCSPGNVSRRLLRLQSACFPKPFFAKLFSIYFPGPPMYRIYQLPNVVIETRKSSIVWKKQCSSSTLLLRRYHGKSQIERKAKKRKNREKKNLNIVMWFQCKKRIPRTESKRNTDKIRNLFIPDKTFSFLSGVHKQRIGQQKVILNNQIHNIDIGIRILSLNPFRFNNVKICVHESFTSKRISI